MEPGQALRGCDADAPDERLTAAAAEAEPVRQLRAFTGWVGSGRTLTQTGRVTLADASELVGLLGTQDRLDPKIGDRVFRTKSSEELPGITTVVTWAKACRLVRVTGGRLVPVKRNAGLLDHPMELWARMFETFPRLGAALCPPGWGEALLRRYKASWFQRPVVPSIVPVGPGLAGGGQPVRQPRKRGWRASRTGSEEAR